MICPSIGGRRCFFRLTVVPASSPVYIYFSLAASQAAVCDSSYCRVPLYVCLRSPVCAKSVDLRESCRGQIGPCPRARCRLVQRSLLFLSPLLISLKFQISSSAVTGEKVSKSNQACSLSAGRFRQKHDAFSAVDAGTA